MRTAVSPALEPELELQVCGADDDADRELSDEVVFSFGPAVFGVFFEFALRDVCEGGVDGAEGCCAA
jgi:hypothetical protein